MVITKESMVPWNYLQEFEIICKNYFVISLKYAMIFILIFMQPSKPPFRWFFNFSICIIHFTDNKHHFIIAFQFERRWLTWMKFWKKFNCGPEVCIISKFTWFLNKLINSSHRINIFQSWERIHLFVRNYILIKPYPPTSNKFLVF